MKIVTEPNKILHQKSQKIRKVDEETRALALEMVKTMKEGKGVGLSAVQVGKPIKLVVTGYEPDKETVDKDDLNLQVPSMILVNPKITQQSTEIDVMNEGCLSFPGIELPVKRSISVNVLAHDLEGRRIKIRAKGFFARVLQHEIDHLDGVTFIDRADKKAKKNLKSEK